MLEKILEDQKRLAFKQFTGMKFEEYKYAYIGVDAEVEHIRQALTLLGPGLSFIDYLEKRREMIRNLALGQQKEVMLFNLLAGQCRVMNAVLERYDR